VSADENRAGRLREAGTDADHHRQRLHPVHCPGQQSHGTHLQLPAVSPLLGVESRATPPLRQTDLRVVCCATKCATIHDPTSPDQMIEGVTGLVAIRVAPGPRRMPHGRVVGCVGARGRVGHRPEIRQTRGIVEPGLRGARHSSRRLCAVLCLAAEPLQASTALCSEARPPILALVSASCQPTALAAVAPSHPHPCGRSPLNSSAGGLRARAGVPPSSLIDPESRRRMMQGDLCWDAIHPDCHLGTSLPTQPLRGHGAPDSDCAPQVLPRRARGSVEDACEFVGPMAMQLIESCIRERERERERVLSGARRMSYTHSQSHGTNPKRRVCS
jgi:hypothetical protein